MRRRNRGGKKSFMAAGDSVTGSGTLSDRALTTGLVYKYLDYVTPKDVDGLKRAYVNVTDNEIEVDPIPADRSAIAQMYGAANVGSRRPTMVATKDSPMALIDKFSPQDKLFPQLEAFGTGLLRAALRKIVDEV
jgi:hypothetical protein